MTQNTNVAVIGALASEVAVKKMIQRSRSVNNCSLGNPTSREDLVIPEQFTTTSKNEKFLQFDSGAVEDRILIFAGNKNLSTLQQSKHLFADGTFKSSPVLFSHLFTINAEFEGAIVPVAFILLPNKEEATYLRAIEALKRLIPQMNPETITTDFEVGLINAFQRLFPTARSKGCYFHFGQCIWRRIQRIPEALTLYKEDETFALNLRMLSAIAYVPQADVPRVFEQLQDLPFFDEHEFLRTLLDYFEDTWVGRLQRRGNRRQPTFPVPLWNVHQSTLNGESRTNNALEGWHLKFSSLIEAHHPTFWKFLEMLKKEQSSSEAKLEHLLAGAPPPAPKRKYAELASRLYRVTSGYGQVATMDFLRGIAHNIEMNV